MFGHRFDSGHLHHVIVENNNCHSLLFSTINLCLHLVERSNSPARQTNVVFNYLCIGYLFYYKSTVFSGSRKWIATWLTKKRMHKQRPCKESENRTMESRQRSSHRILAWWQTFDPSKHSNHLHQLRTQISQTIFLNFLFIQCSRQQPAWLKGGSPNVASTLVSL